MRKKREYIGNVTDGQVFGRWTIVEILGTFNKKRIIKAKCECGTIKEITLYTVISGQSKSCGCLHKEIIAELGKKRATHGLREHPLYGIWSNIKRRCRVEGSEVYHLYGAVGVNICDEWFNDFKVFYDWCIEHGWENGLEIDKDVKSFEKPGKMYSPDFCSIVTPLINSRNKRTTNFITYEGKTFSVQEWAERLNIPYKLMWNRLKKGWSIERIVKEPGIVSHDNFITHNGETLRITEWSNRFNITISSIKKRLKKGWSFKDALETPVDIRFVTNKKTAA